MADAECSSKTCRRCGQVKSRAEFPKKGGKCRPCLSAMAVIRNKRNVRLARLSDDGRDRLRRNKQAYRERLVHRGLTTAGRPRKPMPPKRASPPNRERIRQPWHGVTDQAERSRLRYRLDPQYRVYHRVKRWMQKHLRDGRSSRVWSAFLGYQPAELAEHLQRQFTTGMGWHNMGEWHIDHIVPVSSFRFASPADPEFRACYALSNLRPVWARDNMSKGAKRLHLI